MCFESGDLDTSERENLEIPRLKKPSQFSFVYDRDGILQQTKLKLVTASDDTLEEYRLLNEQRDQNDHFENTRQSKTLAPANTGGPAIGQSVCQAKCPPNIIIKPNTQQSQKQKIDDETPPVKITEKVDSLEIKLMPTDYDYYNELEKTLVIDHGIPLAVFKISLRRCIRHNHARPPKIKPDWLNWAEIFILRDFDLSTCKPEYVRPAELMHRSWGLSKQSIDIYLSDVGLQSNDFIDLVSEFKDIHLHSNIKSFDWEGDCLDWIAKQLLEAQNLYKVA